MKKMTPTQRKVLAHMVRTGKQVRWCISGQTCSNTPRGTKRATLERLAVLGFVARDTETFSYDVGVGLFGRGGTRTKTGLGVIFTLTQDGRQAARRTITPEKLRRLAFCNSKKLPVRIIVTENGERRVKQWVGIGWIDITDHPDTKPDDCVVVTDAPSDSRNNHAQE